MLMFVFSGLIVLLDQFFKRWIVLTHNIGDETVLIPKLLSLFHLENTGAAFGLFADKPWAQVFFLSVSSVAIVVFLIFFVLNLNGSFFLKTSLALIISGAIGNFLDRVVLNSVRDFISVHFFPAIFNVADSMLVAGCIVLVFYFLFLDNNAVFKSKKKTD